MPKVTMKGLLQSLERAGDETERLKKENERMRQCLTEIADWGFVGVAEAGCPCCWGLDEGYTVEMSERGAHLPICPVAYGLAAGQR